MRTLNNFFLSCSSWYHYGCVGLAVGDARLRNGKKFFCPPCEAGITMSVFFYFALPIFFSTKSHTFFVTTSKSKANLSTRYFFSLKLNILLTQNTIRIRNVGGQTVPYHPDLLLKKLSEDSRNSSADKDFNSGIYFNGKGTLF